MADQVVRLLATNEIDTKRNLPTVYLQFQGRDYGFGRLDARQCNGTASSGLAGYFRMVVSSVCHDVGGVTYATGTHGVARVASPERTVGLGAFCYLASV